MSEAVQPYLVGMEQAERLPDLSQWYSPEELADNLDAWKRAIKKRDQRDEEAAQEAARMGQELRRSFVYGNTNISNDAVTREMVDEIADREARS